MLSTFGLVPVAQEFCKADMPTLCGSEFSPVSAECPSAMMPRSGCDAEVVPLNGLADAVPVAADAGPELDPHDAAASKARPAARIAQTRVAICFSCARSRRKSDQHALRPPAGWYRTRRVPGWRTTMAHQSLAASIILGRVRHLVIL